MIERGTRPMRGRRQMSRMMVAVCVVVATGGLSTFGSSQLGLEQRIAALGNDPILVAECLARPLVADRLIRNAYAHDPRYHLALKTAIEQSLARHASVAEMKNLAAEYGESVWMLGGGRAVRAGTLAG